MEVALGFAMLKEIVWSTGWSYEANLSAALSGITVVTTVIITITIASINMILKIW